MTQNINIRKIRYFRKIARERMKILFELAIKFFQTDKKLSQRYIQLMRKIGLRYNVRIPKWVKKRFCKRCNSLLIPGKSCKVRLEKQTECVIYICLECGQKKRYRYK